MGADRTRFLRRVLELLLEGRLDVDRTVAMLDTCFDAMPEDEAEFSEIVESFLD